MTLIQAGYACAPLVTLAGGALGGYVIGHARGRHAASSATPPAEPQRPPAPAAEPTTLVIPRITAEPQWVPRRRPEPRPGPAAAPPPPNGRHAPRARGEEWR